MHFKRWITSLVALPIVIFLVYLGGISFIFLVSLACVLSLWEYFRIVFNAERRPLSNVIVWWGYGVSLLILGSAHITGLTGVAVLIAFNLVFVGLFSIFIYKSNPLVGDIIQKQLQGIVYVPVLLSFLILIRREPDGMTWIFYLLAIIFAGDISAYYVGSYLGRHKLNPVISPGKTIEGAIGGLIGNLLAGIAGIVFFLPTLSWPLAIAFFLAAGIAGQVGDLFESELKRSSSIKDSSGLLPGHGGFLDRIDALLFASPVAYCFIVFIF
ncbi:MAG: phosphatidate cytidylyltransferase [Desulfobacterales bacterium]|nr:MAG: phosphatidate cytidylyltransferase [Desulfobacterales bacterium]